MFETAAQKHLTVRLLSTQSYGVVGSVECSPEAFLLRVAALTHPYIP